MMYAIEYTRAALKDMSRIPARIRATIEEKMARLAKNPAKAQEVKAQKGEDGAYRLRVGDYRVVYFLEHGRLLVVVVKVQHRKDVYR